jgi:hypothetical protein
MLSGEGVKPKPDFPSVKKVGSERRVWRMRLLSTVCMLITDESSFRS